MAYTDPGSGAMFVQIILAALIGGLYKIRRVFSRFREKKQAETATAGFASGNVLER